MKLKKQTYICKLRFPFFSCPLFGPALITCYFLYEADRKPSENFEKSVLFHLKSSFCFQDIQTFLNLRLQRFQSGIWNSYGS